MVSRRKARRYCFPLVVGLYLLTALPLAPHAFAATTKPLQSDMPVEQLEAQGAGAPDDALAAGPAHLVSAVNHSLQIRTLSGTVLSTTPLSDFFPADQTGYIVDPRLSYDASTGRFILAATGRKSTPPAVSTLVLAVSATSDPTGAWYKYVLDAGRGGSPPTETADYTSLGYDGVAIYISFNMFSFADGSFTGNRLMILDKAKAMSGQLVSPSWVLDDISLPQPQFSKSTLAFTLKPVEAVGPVNPFLLMSRAGPNGLALYKLTNPLSTSAPPVITSSYVPVPAYGVPDDAPQLGSTNLLATGDTRLQKTVYRDGVIWTCQTAAPGGTTSTKAQVNFYRIDPSGAGSLLQAVSIADPTRFYYYPAIVPDSHGNAVAVFEGSDSTSDASIYTARYDGATAAFEAPVRVASSPSAYAPSTSSPSPWGDYLDASLDVVTGTNVWVQGMLATTTNTWQMFVTEVASTPATPPTTGGSGGSGGGTTPGGPVTATFDALCTLIQKDITDARLAQELCRLVQQAKSDAARSSGDGGKARLEQLILVVLALRDQHWRPIVTRPNAAAIIEMALCLFSVGNGAPDQISIPSTNTVQSLQTATSLLVTDTHLSRDLVHTLDGRTKDPDRILDYVDGVLDASRASKHPALTPAQAATLVMIAVSL